MKYQANSSCVIMSVIHDHSVLQSIDITKRNLMLITLRALNLLRAWISHCTFVNKKMYTPHLYKRSRQHKHLQE